MSIIVGAPLYLEYPQRYGYSLGNGYYATPAIPLQYCDDSLPNLAFFALEKGGPVVRCFRLKMAFCSPLGGCSTTISSKICCSCFRLRLLFTRSRLSSLTFAFSFRFFVPFFGG